MRSTAKRLKLVLLFIFLVAVCPTKEQGNNILAAKSNWPDKQDTLNSSDFTFHGYHIGDSLAPDAFSKLRKGANSISSDTNYEGDYIYKTLHFQKSSVSFDQKERIIESFEMHDNSFAFVIKGKQLKIGGSDTPVKKMFPISYGQKYPDSDNNKDTLINVYMGDYEGLLFYVRSNKIKAIEYWEDNS